MNEENNNNSWLKAYARVSYLALLFPAYLLAGYFIGKWLDTHFSSDPWLLLLFLLFGFIAALRALLKEVDKMNNENGS